MGHQPQWPLSQLNHRQPERQRGVWVENGNPAKWKLEPMWVQSSFHQLSCQKISLFHSVPSLQCLSPIFTRLGALLRRPVVKNQLQLFRAYFSFLPILCLCLRCSVIWSLIESTVMNIMFAKLRCWKRGNENLRSASWVDSCCTSFWVWSSWEKRWLYSPLQITDWDSFPQQGNLTLGLLIKISKYKYKYKHHSKSQTGTWPWSVFNSFCSPSASSTWYSKRLQFVDESSDVVDDLQRDGSQAGEPVQAPILKKAKTMVNKVRGAIILDGFTFTIEWT